MLSGIGDIRRAGDVLCNRPVSRVALLMAGGHFWSAMCEEPTWPEALRIQAWSVIDLLLKHGGMSTTVPRLTDAELTTLWRDLLAFVQAAERTSD
ncbi:MAG: hypothetical protein HYS13_25885 [Planctomycetia bacterium]|nr:hypothetical protein [Planctomycetia bacterium]